MLERLVRAASVLVLAAGMAACGSSSPTSPTVGAPTVVQPTSGATIKYGDQPVTLVVSNGATSSGATVTYTFEVASDSAFSTRVFSKDGVTQGTDGKASQTISTLQPGTYYWHARAVSGSTVGTYCAAATFTIGPAVTIDAPTPVSPLTGATTYNRPEFTVSDSTRTGSVGAISYRFEISTTQSFGTILMTSVVPETSGETSFTATSDLPGSTTLYWRATAIDTSHNVSSSPSTVQSFTTVVAIDLTQVVYTRGPDVSSWPETATIIAVEQDGNAATNGTMCISFSTSDTWPSVGFFGDDSVPVYANQWYIANINGRWYAGAGEWLRSDRGWCKSGQSTVAIGPDGGWDAPMNTWAPKPGELVGYMVTTPARAWPSMATINERSNVVAQPWYDSSAQSSVSRKSAIRKR